MGSKSFAYRAAAAFLLLAVAASRLASTHLSKAISDYHARIHNSVTLVPDHIGPWVGQDEPVPQRALDLLLPNVMVSRKFINVENGHATDFILVHCSDAHDIVGHYPLRCYPAEGWDLVSSAEFHWQLPGLPITGMIYKFTHKPMGEGDLTHTLTVWNFLMRPNKTVLKDMDSLSDSIIGVSGQAAGAGQIEVCFFDTTLSDDEQQAIAQQLVGGYRPVIDAILASVQL